MRPRIITISFGSIAQLILVRLETTKMPFEIYESSLPRFCSRYILEIRRRYLQKYICPHLFYALTEDRQTRTLVSRRRRRCGDVQRKAKSQAPCIHTRYTSSATDRSCYKFAS